MHVLRILYELSLYDDAKVLSSSSFAKIETFSDSRRVQKVQKYIADHYQEDIRLNTLADMVGMTRFRSAVSSVCVQGRLFPTIL